MTLSPNRSPRRRTAGTWAFLLLLLASSVALAQGGPLYEVQVDQDNVLAALRDDQDKKGLYVTIQFQVLRAGDGQVATDVNKDEIVVKEDGKQVEDLEIFQPKSQELTAVLAMDISHSMNRNDKIGQARNAAVAFLDKLDSRANAGLILFNDAIPTNDLTRVRGPAAEPADYVAHRQELRALINAVNAHGGTAYLDATARGVEMLRGVKGRKAVLVMTDGVDMNSKKTLPEVVELAVANEVPVYTLGIGEAGGEIPVSTVLVLDRSESMLGKANNQDRKTKIEALREAASRFVDLMRPGASTTLIPFSNVIEPAQPFTDDKDKLKARIDSLRPRGTTHLYDATLDGVETLLASGRPGKRAVVVLTDGRDEGRPGSRHSPDAVIARAKDAGIKLYMLGLGRKGEINETVMKKMADETGGEYFHAEDRDSLVRIFEDLSIQIHDDGIDEASLKQLAQGTGGKYYHVRDVSQLQLVYEELAVELQSTYKVTFKSRRQTHDGTARDISIEVYRGGQLVSTKGSVFYNVRGVVVPEMSTTVYLLLLAAVGGFLVLPGLLRSFTRRQPSA